MQREMDDLDEYLGVSNDINMMKKWTPCNILKLPPTLEKCKLHHIIAIVINHPSFNHYKINNYKQSIKHYLKTHSIDGLTLSKTRNEELWSQIYAYCDCNISENKERCQAIYTTVLKLKRYKFHSQDDINGHTSKTMTKYRPRSLLRALCMSRRLRISLFLNIIGLIDETIKDQIMGIHDSNPYNKLINILHIYNSAYFKKQQHFKSLCE